MQFTKALRPSALAGFTILAAHVGAQGTPPAPPPAPRRRRRSRPPAPAGRGQGGGRGATFPAQQRPPGDPVLIERGKGVYTVNCSACHGMDLRGGVTGGPNLLRSAVVLNDQAGELILPIVRGARADKGMPPLPIPDDDIKAVAEYIHSVLSTARGQGAPPESGTPPPNAIVGDRGRGPEILRRQVQRLPFANRRSARHRVAAVRGEDAAEPLAHRRRRRARRPRARRRPAQADHRYRDAAVRREGRRSAPSHRRLPRHGAAGGRNRAQHPPRPAIVPKVEIADPLQAHRALLADTTDKDMHDVTAYLATLK